MATDEQMISWAASAPMGQPVPFAGGKDEILAACARAVLNLTERLDALERKVEEAVDHG